MLGKGGVRWPGLSISLDKTKYGPEWLQSSELGIQQVWNQQVYVYTQKVIFSITNGLFPLFTCVWIALGNLDSTKTVGFVKIESPRNYSIIHVL